MSLRSLHLRAPSRAIAACLFVLAVAPSAGATDHPGHRSTDFSGPKANRGHAIHTRDGAVDVLTLSPDFVVPDAPAPHWQVVDSRGNTYLLQRLKIKGDAINQSIRVPSYVPDIAEVEIWCAWAETLLGKAVFQPQHGESHRTSMFAGPKANRGFVTHSRTNGRAAQKKSLNRAARLVTHRTEQRGDHVLTLSPDFVVPDAPAPHWQLVDSKGNTYLLQALKIKGDKINTSIRVPSYVPDVAKVQIWCAWAETLLGEAAFETPVRVASR